LVQIASGSALVCGFGYALRIRAYGSGIGHIFVFGDVLRIQVWVCLRRLALASGIRFWLWAVDLYVRESIANAGMRDSFGIVQFSGKPEEKRKYYKIS